MRREEVIHELDAILADLEEKYCSDYSEDTLKLYKDCTNDLRIFVDKIKLSDYSVDKIIDCLLGLQHSLYEPGYRSLKNKKFPISIGYNKCNLGSGTTV